MSSISSLARSAVDIVQERIKIQSGKLTKHIETLLGVHRPPPASQSVVGDMNPTTAICQPLGLPLGNEHPGTTLRRSERLAARQCDHGANAEGAEPPEHGWDLYTGESFTTQILDQPPRPRTYSERGMDVTIGARSVVEAKDWAKDDRRLTTNTRVSVVEARDFARDDAAISAEFYGARFKEVVWVDAEETADRHKRALKRDEILDQLPVATDAIDAEVRGSDQRIKQTDIIDRSHRSEHEISGKSKGLTHGIARGGLDPIESREVDQPTPLRLATAATMDDEPYDHYARWSNMMPSEKVRKWWATAEEVPPIAVHPPAETSRKFYYEPAIRVAPTPGLYRNSYDPMVGQAYMEQPSVVRWAAEKEQRREDAPIIPEPQDCCRRPAREPPKDDVPEEPKKPGDNTKPEASSAKITTSSGQAKVKQWLKIGYFDGRTEVEAFIKRFHMCAKNNGWDDEEKLCHLTCALKSPADQLLWEAGADDITV